MRMRLWPRKLGVAALGFAVVAGAMAPTAAQAATAAPATGARLTHAQSAELAHETVTVIRETPRESVIRVSAPKSVGHDSDCVVGLWNGTSYGAPYGENICGTEEVSIYYTQTGRYESFVIGGNYAMWHTWTGQSGWYSLGGAFCGLASCGVYASGSYPNIVLSGWDSADTRLYCDERTDSGGWTGWYGC
jgi:hypothetical protein